MHANAYICGIETAYIYRDVSKNVNTLIHHNLFITVLLGSNGNTLLAKQLYCIQTKMNILYRKMTIYGYFSIYIIYTFLFGNNHVVSKTNI